MASEPLWINFNLAAGVPEYNANEMRQATALGLMYNGRNMGARQGVRPGGNQLEVSLAGSTITVQPGLACIDPGLTSTQGPYWVPIPLAETHPLTAADTNPRKDIVILRVYDHDEDASGLRLARTEYIAGTPAPSPSEPTTPAGSTKLALIDVPQSGGGPAVVTDTRLFTAGAGGIVPVLTAGAIAAAVEGRYRDRLDTNVLERDSGSAWETVADPAVFKPGIPWTPAWTATTTNPVLGNGTLTGRYIQVGKLVHWWLTLLPGSTTTFGVGSWFFSQPVPRNNAIRHDGSGFALDNAPTITYYPVTIRYSGSLMNGIAVGGNGLLSASVPFTWASAAGDELSIGGVYEAT